MVINAPLFRTLKKRKRQAEMKSVLIPLQVIIRHRTLFFTFLNKKHCHASLLLHMQNKQNKHIGLKVGCFYMAIVLWIVSGMLSI